MLANHSFTAYDEVAVLFAVSTGDQKAFAALFSRYKDRVYTIALTYTENRTIAEEIVQDVFMRVWKNRPKLKEINNFSSWIHVIARNRALTELQKIAREGERREELISYLPAEVSDAEQKVQDNSMEELLEKALTRLSPQQRKVFVLTRLQGHTRTEVAEMLHLAPATVSVHLAIALRSIRAFLTNQLELTALLLFFLFF
jgi:RNA polymerase sigma-70 factor (ECF subfamily)